MKILLIDEEFPYPLNSGKRIRTFNLTYELACANDVTYLAYGDENSDSFKHLKENKIKPVAVEAPDRKQAGLKYYLKLLLNILSPYPYIVTSHYTKRFDDKVKELVARENYDVIICEWTPYAIFLKELKDCKSIIVSHNIESQIWRRYEQNETNLPKRMYITHQRKKVEAFEDKCFHWVNGATAVSKDEVEVIKSFGVKYAPAVVDNGVDINYFHPMDDQVEPETMVLTGAMDWRPNQDAAVYFTEKIFPLIKKEKPNAKVIFVGRNPSAQVKELANGESVEVTGTVDDVRSYIARANVFIVPLRIGGGSRLKILEAMGMKKAVVSTAVGAEGLNITDRENILIADDPQSFATAVIDCINNIELNQKLAQNGNDLVNSQYRWDILGKKFNEYLIKVTGVK